ncbi:hypothetical protein BSKO_12948 [Bryopsis sp. KO-2023]|nr:hypothetical protein BSKO_12948 [Bryopsis sp. KO-2023]
MSERLGCPIRPYTVLPGKAFPRTPFAGAKKCEADNKAKSEEAAHLVDLKRAVRLLTCFQLQLNFVCAETEAAILRHREKAEAQLVEGAVATHQLKKNLLAARIQSVKHLKASVNWAMEETSNIGTAIGIRPGKKKIMMKHMQRALEALNALDAIISEKGFATTLTGTSDPPRVSSGKLDLLKPPLERLGGLTDTVAKCQEALVEGENISVLKCGAERPMEAGGDKKKAGGNLKGHRRPLEKIQALVGANIQKQRTLGFLRMQAAQMNVSVDVGGKRESRSQARSNRPVDRLA